MASKKAEKNPVAVRFSKRLREVAAKKKLTIDGMVRLSPRLRFGTLRSWWDGARLPGPAHVVDLASALEMSPLLLIKGVGMDKKAVMDIEFLMREEASRAQPG